MAVCLGYPFVVVGRHMLHSGLSYSPVLLRRGYTDTQGTPLLGRKIVSRRKHLCKNWWNDDWLNRMLAVCQFLADGDALTIGEVTDEQVVISATPRCWDVPFGIDEDLLEKNTTEREDAMLPPGPDGLDDEEEGDDDDHDD